MGVHRHGGTPEGAVTPICNECGVSLCWDIPRIEYIEAKAFWDAWRCQECNGSRLSAFGWRKANGREALPAPVETVVSRFEAAFPELATAACARGRAREVSQGFIRELALHGIQGTLAVAAVVGGTEHHVVSVGDFSIDWTAVQHDADAPTPLVYRTSLGWPIEPRARQEILDAIAALDDAEFDQLVARIQARRAAS